MTAPLHELSIDVFADAGVLCSEQDVLPDAFVELAQRIERDAPIVAYEVAGLAERIRAGLNGSPRPVPTKPAPPPPPPKRPPPPPTKPGGK